MFPADNIGNENSNSASEVFHYNLKVLNLKHWGKDTMDTGDVATDHTELSGYEQSFLKKDA